MIRGKLAQFSASTLSTKIPCALLLSAALLTGSLAAAKVQAPATDYGKALAAENGANLTLANNTISATWTVSGGVLKPVSMMDRITGKPIPIAKSLFAVTLHEGDPITSADMKVVGTPKIEKIAAKPDASRMAERLNGEQITAELADSNGKLGVIWRAILRDGSSYIRQEFTFQAKGADLPVSTVRLIDVDAPGAAVSGSVKGSPVVAHNVFFGFEHPISDCTVTRGRAVCLMYRELPLKAGQSVTYSSVVGVTPPGQLRRGFLAYIERERAHPYRPFLHYNSWYDLGYFSKFDEKGALDVINTFGTELVRKRGVKMDSFLFDDGWDDNKSLWHFNSGFPNGFAPLKEAAEKYNASIGVWLSPWGGYGQPREERLKYGKEQGFETNDGGFALSGPKYFERFREITLEFIKKYGVNQFKIDGTGNVNSAIKGSQFDSDFHAAISLMNEWRTIKPDIYVNLTTGTYPSPFWLQYADSIWRGGEDHSFAGVGSWRERWITYRDADTYRGIVQAGPLYPLNSLMLHGLIYAKHAQHLDTDPSNDFKNEVRDYFGTGTQLQEMYITPALLNDKDWDVIAESAKWSRANADVLVDTHWIGGDPAMLEVYGWASWSPRKGILVLRNPSDKPQSITIDVAKAFEVPVGGARVYKASIPWQEDHGLPTITLACGTPHRFTLQPFEVLTLDAMPQ